MKSLAVALGLLAVAVFVAGALVLNTSNVDVPGEIGKWLLTMATALAVTGALSAVIKQIDERRARRAAWEMRLNTVISSNHAVVVIRLLLRADKTASAYRDQIAELTRTRAQLRGLQADGAVLEFPELRAAVKAMRRYLDAIGEEYEAGYLAVARQQRIDDERLKQLVEDAANKAAGVPLDGDLAAPMSAWDMLADHARFPRLVEFLDDETYEAGTYRTGYTDAKHLLEDCAGIERPV